MISWGLDLGSSKISLVGIRKVKPLEIVFSKFWETDFIESGYIKDFYGMVEFLDKIFKKTEIETGFKIDDLNVNISGSFLNTKFSDFSFVITEEKEKLITKRDTDYIIKQAQLLALNWTEKLLHTFPQEFIIDDTEIVKNPVGLWGRKLKGNIFIISTPLTIYENIKKLFEFLDKNLKNLIFSGIAQSQIFLDSDLKNQGCVLVDVGDTLTEVLSFEAGILKSVKIINQGLRNITRKISEDFEISLELAKKVKEEFVNLESPSDEEIMVRLGSDYKKIEVSKVKEIMVNQIKNIFEEIKDILKKENLFMLAEKNLVVCGGIVQIKGFCKIIEESFGKSPLVPQIEGLDTKRNSLALGLAIMGFESRKKRVFNKFLKLINTLKEIYSEYF